MSFSKDFVWGAAAASYQIEGGAFEDGKGLSIWDVFCKQEGKIWNGCKGDVGCDHYHRYQEDVDLMAEIGLNAYRMSISWPRVMPEGTGSVNEKGLEFYDRVIDALLEKNIQPWVTLYHWDLPYELQLRGGWLNPDMPEWFADYAKVVVDRLSDRVTHWMTINEPQCFIDDGLGRGGHAPGLVLPLSEVLVASHNALLAHGKSTQVIRANAKIKSVVGAAPVGSVRVPLTDSPEDIEATRRSMFDVTGKGIWNNAWFADPMVLGSYPEDGVKLMGEDMVEIKPGDMETICQPLDFYGANIYQAWTVKQGEDGKPEFMRQPDAPAMTAMEWLVTPEALYWGPKMYYDRYKLPIVVTENGMAGLDWVHEDGKVHDPQRIDFLTKYLRSFKRAAEEGIPCLGYFQWSIMDNFEWGHGPKKRFGLIHIDYDTLKRTPKDSAYWYKGVIASNGESL